MALDNQTLVTNQIERLNKAKNDIKTSILSKGGIVSDDALIGDYADIIKNLEDLFSIGNHNYKVAPVDEAGLKEIGWGNDDINYLKYNTLIPKGEDVGDRFVVSDANKQIVINSKSDIATYKDNVDFKFCPKFDTSEETNMSNMFSDCKTLTTIPLFDTINVTIMNRMFYNCHKLTNILLLDTSNVTDMGNMFYDCASLTTIPLLNTANVTSMIGMFLYCTHLITIPLLNTTNVTSMSSMFSRCTSLITIPLLNTANVTSMSDMFYNCNKLTSIPQLNTDKVTNMSTMFYSCSSLTSIPQFDTSKVTNMMMMFYNCSSLTSIPLLDTSKIVNTMYMFSKCDKLTNLGGFTGLNVDLDLSPCPLLTKESILNVFNKAADVTSSSQTLTLGTVNLSKLTDTEKAIATRKGWVLN